MPAEQSFLVISRSSPYGSHLARAGIDLALTAAAFEQKVTMVFMDEGVLQVLEGQDTGNSGIKNVGRMIPALALYDVEKICVDQDSAQRFGVTEESLPEGVEFLSSGSLKTLLESADQVMVF